MARRTNDPRTVKVRHPDKGEFTVTPEVAGVLNRTEGFEILGGRGAPAARSASSDELQQVVKDATEPLQARIEELQLEATKAAEDHAQQIADLEQQLAAAQPTPPAPGDDKAAKAKEA